MTDEMSYTLYKKRSLPIHNLPIAPFPFNNDVVVLRTGNGYSDDFRTRRSTSKVYDNLSTG